MTLVLVNLVFGEELDFPLPSFRKLKYLYHCHHVESCGCLSYGCHTQTDKTTVQKQVCLLCEFHSPQQSESTLWVSLTTTWRIPPPLPSPQKRKRQWFLSTQCHVHCITTFYAKVAPEVVGNVSSAAEENPCLQKQQTHTHTHNYTLSNSHTHTHTQNHTHTLSHSFTHTHTPSLSFSFTLA